MKSKLLTQAFLKFRKEKTQGGFLNKGRFCKWSTQKKASKNQGDLRLLQLLSSELLQDQNENQTQ